MSRQAFIYPASNARCMRARARRLRVLQFRMPSGSDTLGVTSGVSIPSQASHPSDLELGMKVRATKVNKAKVHVLEQDAEYGCRSSLRRLRFAHGHIYFRVVSSGVCDRSALDCQTLNAHPFRLADQLPCRISEYRCVPGIAVSWCLEVIRGVHRPSRDGWYESGQEA